jgi:uncharacterized membrane protein
MNAIRILIMANLLLLGYVITLAILSVLDVAVANLRIHFSVNLNYYFLAFIITSLAALAVRSETKKAGLSFGAVRLLGF